MKKLLAFLIIGTFLCTLPTASLSYVPMDSDLGVFKYMGEGINDRGKFFVFENTETGKKSKAYKELLDSTGGVKYDDLKEVLVDGKCYKLKGDINDPKTQINKISEAEPAECPGGKESTAGGGCNDGSGGMTPGEEYFM